MGHQTSTTVSRPDRRCYSAAARLSPRIHCNNFFFSQFLPSVSLSLFFFYPLLLFLLGAGSRISYLHLKTRTILCFLVLEALLTIIGVGPHRAAEWARKGVNYKRQLTPLCVDSVGPSYEACNVFYPHSKHHQPPAVAGLCPPHAMARGQYWQPAVHSLRCDSCFGIFFSYCCSRARSILRILLSQYCQIGLRCVWFQSGRLRRAFIFYLFFNEDWDRPTDNALFPRHTAVAVLSSRRLYPFSHRVHAKCTVPGLKTATTIGQYRPMSRQITHTMSTEQPVVFRCLAFIGLLSLSCRLLSSPLLCPFARFYITGRLDLCVMGRSPWDL